MDIKSPYAVICPAHGQVFLTAEQYMKQLMLPDMRWTCIICGEVAEFDDENYESTQEAEV